MSDNIAPRTLPITLGPYASDIVGIVCDQGFSAVNGYLWAEQQNATTGRWQKVDFVNGEVEVTGWGPAGKYTYQTWALSFRNTTANTYHVIPYTVCIG